MSYTTIKMDDSSDEEDKVNTYDIVTRLNDYREDNKKVKIDQNWILSFISHAAGVYSLYSSKVQKRYYELKRSFIK